MKSEKIVSGWKRGLRSGAGDGFAQDHPSGAVELPEEVASQVHGGTGDVTDLLSCGPRCTETFIQGTCRWWTAGCCGIQNNG